MKLTLPIPPSANRLWRRAGSTIHRSQEYVRWREAALWALAEQGVLPEDRHRGPVAVRIDLVGPVGIDTDNAIKATLDILQHAGLYANDRQVRRLLVERAGGDGPAHLEVTVGAMA